MKFSLTQLKEGQGAISGKAKSTNSVLTKESRLEP